MKTYNIILSEQQLQITQQSLRNAPSSEIDDDMNCPISESIASMIDIAFEYDKPDTVRSFVL